MATYRKKHTVEAFRFWVDDHPSWFTEALDSGVIEYGKWSPMADAVWVTISHGAGVSTRDAIATGDYVVQKHDGKIWVVRKEAFEAEYEPTGEGSYDRDE